MQSSPVSESSDGVESMVYQRQDLEQILRRVLEKSAADETEVCLLCSDDCITRFSMNRIHQNMVEEKVSLGVRVRQGNRIGAAATTLVSDETIEHVLAEAISLAEIAAAGQDGIAFAGEDDICRTVPAQEPLPPVDPIAIAHRVRSICADAQGEQMQAAGNFTVSQSKVGIGTSHGVVVVGSYSNNFLNVMVLNVKGHTSGWASSAAKQASLIKSEALAQEALGKARVQLADEPCPAGNYPVVLDTYAVAEMISTLAVSGFNAWSYHNGASVVSGKLGERVFQETVTIRDDGFDPRGCPRAFDFDGVCKQVVPLVEAGVVTGVVYDRASATEFGRHSTGHAQPRPALYLPGPQAENLFFEVGNANMEDLLTELERGLYVTRFQYTTVLDPSDLTINGTSRDGTFWVEDGKIKYALPNVSFRFSIVDALRDVRRIGADSKLLNGLFGVVHAPPILLDSFTIV